MDLLNNAFKYGVIGRNYYSNIDKNIISSYKMLKNFSISDIENKLRSSKNISLINIPRCTALLLFIDRNEFQELFDKEVSDIRQLMVFWRALKVTEIVMNRTIISAISNWVIKNLNEELSINYKRFLKEIMTRIRFKPSKRMGLSVVVNAEYILYDNNFLPKSRAILKIKTDFIKGIFREKEHLELIRKYKININEIRRLMYELLDQEKEKAIIGSIANSSPEDFKFLKEVFPEKIPDKVKEACINRINNSSFYEVSKVKELIAVSYKHNKSVEINNTAKIFIDTSYSMTGNTEDIGYFMEYLNYACKIGPKFFVGERVVEFDNYPSNLVLLDKGCNCLNIVSNIEENDTILFITDGNTDLYSFIKEFRTKFSKTRLIVWFINCRNDHPSKFKDIYYFYGKSEDLYEIIQEFITKE